MIFPNPSNDIITISTNFNEAINYEIIDAQGRIVLKGIFSEAKSILNIEALNPGAFLLKLENLIQILQQKMFPINISIRVLFYAIKWI